MALAATGFEVVKTPHHGSANLDDDLMAAVAAPVGIISVGKDNDYGHPAAHHLDVLRHDGYAVYRTDQRGDVAVVERGKAVVVRHRPLTAEMRAGMPVSHRRGFDRAMANGDGRLSGWSDRRSRRRAGRSPRV